MDMSAIAMRILVLTAACLSMADASAKDDAPAHQWVLYRPSNSTFYVKVDPGKEPPMEIPYGAAGDVPLYADFNGTGKRIPALYRKGQWLISSHADGKPDAVVNFGGQPGDIPLAVDIDGDNRADLVIFRGGEWHVRGTRNLAVTQIVHFGLPGDVPLLADFDGDGKIDFAVFRAGHWYVDTNRDGKAELDFAFGGMAGERAIVGDWDLAGHAVPMLFRDGEWLVSAQHDGKVSARAVFGSKGDIPVAVSIAR